jgi:hypothetical protein
MSFHCRYSDDGCGKDYPTISQNIIDHSRLEKLPTLFPGIAFINCKSFWYAFIYVLRGPMPQDAGRQSLLANEFKVGPVHLLGTQQHYNQYSVCQYRNYSSIIDN